MDYYYLEAILKNPYIKQQELDKLFEYFNSDVFKTQVENKQDILTAIKYWYDFYTKIKEAKDWDELKLAVEKYMIVKSNANIKSKYNMVINISKAVTHQLWWKLNELKQGKTLDDGILLFRQILGEIAKQQGYQNGEELMDSIDV